MFGLWHWKHLLTRTSLPGASGKPATGLRCASAGWDMSSAARSNRLNSANLRRKIADDEFLKLNFGAGIVDVDADEISVCIVVKLYAFGDFLRIDAGMLRKSDIQRICLRVVAQFHLFICSTMSLNGTPVDGDSG